MLLSRETSLALLKLSCFVLLTLVILPVTAVSLNAQEIEIKAPNGWRGESVALPPPFAPELKLKGRARLQFSPGMFDQDSGLFFTYVYAFETEAEPKLDKQVIEDSLLAYYQGLAKLVSRGRDIDTDSFSIELKTAESAQGSNEKGSNEEGSVDNAASKNSDSPRVDSSDTVQSYVGKLVWTEPFRTNAKQTLKLELESRFDSESKKQYLFVCASPSSDEDVWKQLDGIRDDFNKRWGSGE